MHSVSSLFCLHNCLPSYSRCMNYKLHGQIMSWVTSIYESRLCMAPTSTTIYNLHRCEQAVNEGPYSWSCHACFNFSHLCFRSHWCCMLAVPFTYWVQVDVQLNEIFYDIWPQVNKQKKAYTHMHNAVCKYPGIYGQLNCEGGAQVQGWTINPRLTCTMCYVFQPCL